MEKKRTDRGQNDENNVTVKVKMGDIMGPLKSYSKKKSGQNAVKVWDIM